VASIQRFTNTMGLGQKMMAASEEWTRASAKARTAHCRTVQTERYPKKTVSVIAGAVALLAAALLRSKARSYQAGLTPLTGVRAACD
jgi:hypothetical protein